MIEPLPSLVFTIKGVEWKVIGTADTDEGVMDTLRNSDTAEIKTIERMKLIKYLQKVSPEQIQHKEKSVNLSIINNQLNFKL